MKTGVKIAIILIVCVAVFGCKKKDPTPVPPVITFKEAYLSQDNTYSIIKFEFYDGDGDLGLKQDENTGDREFNLLVDYYEKVNGVWVLKSPVITYNTSEAKYDTTYLHTRIPFIENENNDALEGDMEIDLLYHPNLYLNTPQADTIRYEIILLDRALQQSNKITTSELVIN